MPMSVFVDTYGTGKRSDAGEEALRECGLRRAFIPGGGVSAADCWCSLCSLSRERTSHVCGARRWAEILQIVKDNFDLRPGCIIRDLDLLRPIYLKTAAYGHFGRDEAEFTWEKPKALTYAH